MLKRKSLKRIYLTTLVLFIMLVSITIDYLKVEKDNNIIETEYVSNLKTTHIYLLNQDNLLVKVDYLLRYDNLNDNIKDILNELYVTNKKNANLKGIIPSNTKINEISINDNTASIDFSNDLLKVKVNLEEKVIESIVYSLIELDGINNVKISIDGKPLEKLEKSNKNIPIVLDSSIGINKDYSINSIKDIESVTVYYVFNVSNNDYFVPVTKYVNSKDSKVKIIIDSLKGNYFSNTNLRSYLSRNTNIDFKIENDILTLTFDSLNDENLESVTYSLASSIFDSMDINKVIFEVDSQIVDVKNKN
ncbi:MAG: GerMN domain-containing protein [Bacilli bacterium]|nr:GerMN domain-containing protein [Bacilli bacterium]